ncbi:hypothetical protein [Streptomyces sp. NRRL S-87]|uniref:hypothetical protein n=1 Tax=Streptomyces sp. NRRL S-87 TaxID=1463920 RepID=UPI0004BF370A|nr:hypothetical protein [Streptomyces sp. NRRL S-87]
MGTEAGQVLASKADLLFDGGRVVVGLGRLVFGDGPAWVAYTVLGLVAGIIAYTAIRAALRRRSAAPAGVQDDPGGETGVQ